MERVNLLIERTGERIACLLNPEDLEARRIAGVRRRAGSGGVLMGGGRTDDPLVATGGGVTEYDLRLLFDVDVAREGRPPRDAAAGAADVREMTRPLWDLAENAQGDAVKGPPRVRIIWGKAWNVPGVVLAVAERLERFDADGAPQRSWLSLRLRRVEDEAPPPPPTPRPAAETEPTELLDPLEAPATDPGLLYDRIDVPTDLDGTPLERLDLIAATHYGDPGLAPALAAYNGLDQLLRLPPGASLALPPAAVLRGTV